MDDDEVSPPNLTGLKVLSVQDMTSFFPYDTDLVSWGARVIPCRNMEETVAALVGETDIDFALIDSGIRWENEDPSIIARKLAEKFNLDQGKLEERGRTMYRCAGGTLAYERGPWIAEIMHAAGISAHCLTCLVSTDLERLTRTMGARGGNLKASGVRDLLWGGDDEKIIEFAALALAEKLTRGEEAANRAQFAAAMRQAAAKTRP